MDRVDCRSLLRRGPALFVVSIFGLSVALAQSWRPLTNQPSFEATLALLLTDGTVICQAYESSDWYRLTPDSSGSYINGTWSQIASLPAGYAPLYYASAVLADGRVVIMGGEYNGGSGTTDQGAIYDPVANTWTALPPPAGWNAIGDASSTVLADGRFLLANPYGQNLAILDPASLTWTPSAASKPETNAEENWTLLPNGNVLTVDLIHTSDKPDVWLYVPSEDNWLGAGDLPVFLTGAGTNEIGPPVLRTNGTVFYPGTCAINSSLLCTSNAPTAFYDPSKNPLGGGTWREGPNFPDGLDIADGPGALLPNGDILLMTSPGLQQTGAVFFLLEGERFNPVAGPPRASVDSSYYGHMLLLPTGQVFFTDDSSDVEIFTPAGTYEQVWAPKIKNAPSQVQAGSTYLISGTQFNGLSQGASYGDDAQMATNYPLVRVTNAASGHVAYWRTHDHSTMGVATGSKIVSTHFDVPLSAEPGATTLVVVANGIPSLPVNVTVTGVP